ncbi:MAG: hypothetical protein ACRDN8_24495, partial [Thermoleophilaceae bacterium]
AILLSITWGPFSPSTAYTLSHIIGVVLLTSSVVPAALLARRVIEAPLLRILAVVLSVAVPWLMIGSHLLAESLAFPLYLWAVYGIVRAAEEPSLARQAGALAAIAALGLARLNLAFVLGVLFVAVVAGEVLRRRSEREEPLGGWLRQALRREALVVAAGMFALAALIVLAVGGTSGLGAYGTVGFDAAADRLFGDGASETRRAMLTYTRSLVVGGFVFPFAIGLGVALAGVAGRAGRRLFLPSLVALSGFAVVVVAVSIFTVGAPLEERYVFYVNAPIAILAVAGLDQVHRLRGWLAGGSALTLWALIAGYPLAAADARDFFTGPAGAFWSRVINHRLLGWEQDLFGWMFLGPTGWLLVAAGLVAMLIFIGVARGRPRLVTAVLAAGLALCAAGQVAALNYDLDQELYGTVDFPGGIALSDDRGADRETWLDDQLPEGARAAIMPGIPTVGAGWGGIERVQFWNRALDATVVTPWNRAPSPGPAGYAFVNTWVGPDGLARWSPRPEWVAAYRDDPRVQFPGRLVARSPVSPYALYRTADSDRAAWTSVGLEADGAVLRGEPVTMTLDPDSASGASAVVLTLQPVDGATAAVRWRLIRQDRPVAAGRLGPGQSRRVRVPVPACRAGAACPPVKWKLRASGPAVEIPLPDYARVGSPRPVILKVVSARIGAER